MGGCTVYSAHEFCHNLLHKTCADILKQLKMIVFWNIVTCSLAESDSHFKLHTTTATTLMMEAVHTADTLVYVNETACYYIPKSYCPHICCHLNKKSHTLK
jgi:site-specific DNA-adenine methylase